MNGTTYRPATGDFNDDGRHDIFWHNPGSATDYIWNGNTTKGTFTMGAAANQLAGTHEPVAEDFDGDGFDDVFFYGPGTEPDEIHYGTATSFMLGVETGVDVSGTYTASAGDFDGDGHGDVYWYTPSYTDPDYLWYGTPTRGVFDGIVDAPSISYAYDGDGLRQSKTIELLGVETTTIYTWDTNSGAYPLLLAETTDGDTTRYLYGPGGTPYGQHNPDGTITYLRHDQLGSTRLLTDEAGVEVGSYTYDPYGQTVAESGSVSTPFGYAGEYTDAETGFQYLRARYYDPTTGQFLTKDPIAPTTRETYGYVAGNPLNATDPLGLCGWSDPWNCIDDAAEAVGSAIPEGVRDTDLGTFDWGTALAGSSNIGIGGLKVGTGVAAAIAGSIAIPFTAGISGPPAYLYAAYQVPTGGAKMLKGVRQYTQVLSEGCETAEDQRLGANASRFVEGMLPNPDQWLDLVGGL